MCAGEWAPSMSMARSDSESALHCKRRARSISALRRAAGPLSRPLRNTCFLASGARVGGTGAGGGIASCLGGGTGRADRSGAGVDPDAPSARCSEGSTPSATSGAQGTSVRGGAAWAEGTAEAGAAEAVGEADRLVPAEGVPTSEERGSVGSHFEHQLLGTRGKPTALTLRTSLSSTGSNLTESSLTDPPAELGGPGGSEAGLAPFKDE
mmetsp:Transcript_11359/g.26712  ORF Transcript_11359/g.26712 Transcript_11359/m.26712 type:complete len:209 (+) Transcript_11359:682-1308(+)